MIFPPISYIIAEKMKVVVQKTGAEYKVQSGRLSAATLDRAENAVTYIQTKFFHFMFGLKKITQNTTSKSYEYVPMQDFSKPWTDEELYKKYELTQDEINYIESSVWSNKGGNN